MTDLLLRPQHHASLIEAAYVAATEPEGWRSFIARLGASCNAAVSFYLIPADDPTRTVVGLDHGHDSEFLQRYGQEHGQSNVLTDRLSRATGAVNVCRDLCTRDVLKRSALYSDWMRPQGFESSASLHLLEDGGNLLSLALMRRGSDLFDVPHRQALQGLMPHLHRALTIARRLQGLETLGRTHDALMSSLQLPLGLLDHQARVHSLNPAAEALMGCGRGLLVSQGRLQAADAVDQQALDQALALASGAAGPRQAHGFVLRGSGFGPRLRVTLCPMPDPEGPFGLLGPRVLLLLHDPGAATGLNEAAVREAFDLSGAEARLALQLCAGLSVEQAAAANGVRVSTVRSQLHSLLLKTGTQRQADLVRLLLAAVGLRLG